MRDYFISTTDTAANWRNEGACFPATLDSPELEGAWDGPGHEMENVAKAICVMDCAARLRCLKDACSDPASEGMRGGFFFENGTVTVTTNRDMHKELGLKAPQRNRPREMSGRGTLSRTA